MPGPSNTKRKPRKSAGKQQKLSPTKKSRADGAEGSVLSNLTNTANSGATDASGDPSPALRVEFEGHRRHSPIHILDIDPAELQVRETVEPVTAVDSGRRVPDVLPQTPFIYDPGNGPRVRDTGAFLKSFFAQGPALDDAMCAEFAQAEVLQMLKTVLPTETAMILWYNKSRSTGRICPACQRLYRLGDVLPGHMDSVDETGIKEVPLQLGREQELSGLCSPVCFILASFNHPGVIKSAWGRLAEEMEEDAWQILNGPGEGHAQGDVSQGLAMLVRMTRLHDLGLAQLCFPDVNFDEDDAQQR